MCGKWIISLPRKLFHQCKKIKGLYDLDASGNVIALEVHNLAEASKKNRARLERVVKDPNQAIKDASADFRINVEKGSFAHELTR